MIAGRWAEAPRCAVLPLHAVTAFEQTSARTIACDRPWRLCRSAGADPAMCPLRDDERGSPDWWGPLLEQNDGLCSASLGAFAVCS